MTLSTILTRLMPTRRALAAERAVNSVLRTKLSAGGNALAKKRRDAVLRQKAVLDCQLGRMG